uniref:C2 domain-containing protein n=1 Tax=Rhabditophanes sp. KR3021 TaxID=114890 RepID=A0AC35UH74_9BILA
MAGKRKVHKSNIHYIHQTVEADEDFKLTVLEEPDLCFKLFLKQDNFCHSNSDISSTNKVLQRSTSFFKKWGRFGEKGACILSIDVKTAKLNIFQTLPLSRIEGKVSFKIKRKNCTGGSDDAIFGIEELNRIINKMFTMAFLTHKKHNDIEELRSDLMMINDVLQNIVEYYGMLPLSMRLLVLARLVEFLLDEGDVNLRSRTIVYNLNVIKGACLLSQPKAHEALTYLGSKMIKHLNTVLETNGSSYFFPPEYESVSVGNLRIWTDSTALILSHPIWDNPVANVHVQRMQSIIKCQIEKNVNEWFIKRFAELEDNNADNVCNIIDEIYLNISTNHENLSKILAGYKIVFTDMLFDIIDEKLKSIIKATANKCINDLRPRVFCELENFTRSTMRLFDALKQYNNLQEAYHYKESGKFEGFFEDISVFWTHHWTHMSNKLIFKALEPQDSDKRSHSDSISSILNLPNKNDNLQCDTPCFESAVYCLAVWKALADDYLRLRIKNPGIARIITLRIVCIFSENLITYAKELNKGARKKYTFYGTLKAANSIEHVVTQLSKNLPRFLELQTLQKLLDGDEFLICSSAMNKIMNTSRDICGRIADELMLQVLTKKREIIRLMCKNLTSCGKFKSKRTFKSIVKNLLNQEGLENLLYFLEKQSKTLEGNVYTRLKKYALTQCWMLVECFISDSLMTGQPIKYYESMENACNQIAALLMIEWDREKSSLWKTLKINQETTSNLILQYYSRLGDRTINTPTPHGSQTLTLKVGYVQTKGKEVMLHIFIMKANNVPVLDTISSDPYVRIELMPRYLFSLDHYPAQTTNYQRKCLNPRWNKAFTIVVPCDKFFINGAALCLSVIDHDIVAYNDLAGQAFIPLSTLPKMPSSEIQYLPTPVIVPFILSNTSQFGMEFPVLKERSQFDDVIAKEFVDYELHIKNYRMLPLSAKDDKEFAFVASTKISARKQQIGSAFKNIVAPVK